MSLTRSSKFRLELAITIHCRFILVLLTVVLTDHVCVCSDTVSRSGMFCAIATTIERCKTEGVVDVFQVVKALSTCTQTWSSLHSGQYHNHSSFSLCPNFVLLSTLQWQYEAVFDAVLVFIDSFDTYANFGQ